MKPEVPAIRQASRQIVRELHLLDTRHSIEGHSFSECHLLTELERFGQATASELGERLVLEKSTISRLVRSLARHGQIRVAGDPSDGRQRLLTLTEAGRKALKRIHRYSDTLVDDALAYLPGDDRDRVVAGLERYAKALRYARVGHEYRIRPIRRSDNPAVARLIRDVMTEHGAVGCGFSIQDPEVDAMYEAYPAPHSTFHVIERGGKVFGCGGMGPLAGGDAGVCELRKMYFRPEIRGLGLGSRLLGMILDDARAAGYTLCYLETLETMAQARKLYARFGFAEHAGPLGSTGHTGCNRFMTLAL